MAYYLDNPWTVGSYEQCKTTTLIKNGERQANIIILAGATEISVAGGGGGGKGGTGREGRTLPHNIEYSQLILKGRSHP